ncbi:hypothetical protein MBLNU459_g0895t1 [Dothideomycetes sp. NU459]
MPCDNTDHSHVWPDSGVLVVERCERFCAYCEGAKRQHEWKYSWFLRRHIRNVHCRLGDRPDVVVSEDWTDMPASKRSRALPHTTPVKKTASSSRVEKTIKKEPQTPSPKKRDSSISPVKSATPSVGIMLALMEASLNDEELNQKSAVKRPSIGEAAAGNLGPRKPAVEHSGADKTASGRKSVKTEIQQSPSKEDHSPGEHGKSLLELEYLKHSYMTAVRELASQGLAAGLSTQDVSLALAKEAKALAGQ